MEAIFRIQCATRRMTTHLVNRYRATFDSIHALRSRNQIFALVKDLAVSGEGNGSFAAFNGEVLGGPNDKLLGFRQRTRRRKYTSQHNPSLSLLIRNPNQHGVAFNQRECRCFGGLKQVAEYLS